MKKYIILIFTIFLIAQVCNSQTYKSYKYSRKQTDYFSIEFNYKTNSLKFTGYVDANEYQIDVFRNDLKISENNIYYNDILISDNKQITIDNKHFLFENITDTRVEENSNRLTIHFLTSKSQTVVDRFKKGNRFDYDNNIMIDSNVFIRGCVISIISDIDIVGEINKDVISLFGNIRVLSNGVIRGNMVTLLGEATLDKQASVYGETYSYDKKGKRKYHQFLQAGDEFLFSENIAYNRIDGLKLAGEVKYHDINSILPSATVEAGYALSSKRIRFKMNLEQKIKYEPNFILGVSFFKKLASDDDFIIGDKENTAFAMFFTEDYKDFYEAEGSNIYLKFRPNRFMSIETGYEYFESNWLRSHRHLWSLFGGDKLFRYNFSTVNDIFRQLSIEEIDGSSIGSIYSNIEYSTELSFNNPFDKSGWKISASIEWVHPDLSSDFDFKRYMINVRRFHKINNRSVIIARGIFANSDGYLPMHRRYYLGGIGSLPGYSHKEFLGTSYWMTNLEYRFIFYKNQISLAPNWNSAQIANDESLNSGIEIKNSIGLGIYIANQLKFEFAKRLDRSEDAKFKFYVRFDQQF